MRELEAKIAAWRKTIHATLPDEPEIVRELEAHLREDIAVRCQAGEVADTAFALATERLGEPQDLAREFARVRAPWWPRSWVLRGILVLANSLGLTVVVMIALGLGSQRLTPMFAAHGLAITMGYLSAFCTGLVGLAALVRAWRRPLSPEQRRELRALMFRLTCVSAACLPIGLVLGMVWARESLGAAWSWRPTEVGALFVLLATVLLLIAQLSIRVSDRIRFVIAMVGATAVAFGMLGAQAVTAAVPITWLVLAFACSQGAVAVLRHRSQPATS